MDVVINDDIDAVPEGYTPTQTHGNFYHNILACLAYPIDAPPVADLLRRHHGLEGDWLIASPIHWQATHNDAMIVASGHELKLSTEESRVWCAELAAFSAFVDIKLHYHDASTWLLQRDGKPKIIARPVHTLHHQSMMPELKKLDETLFWQRYITENQMFFSEHPLNKARKESYSINGLWLWGGGNLHERGHKTLVCANEGLQKLATLLSTSVSSYQSGKMPNSRGLTAGSSLDAKSMDPAFAADSVLLFDTLNEHERAALQTQLQKNTVHWYWNNVAYTSKPKSWWSRLLERFYLC